MRRLQQQGRTDQSGNRKEANTALSTFLNSLKNMNCAWSDLEKDEFSSRMFSDFLVEMKIKSKGRLDFKPLQNELIKMGFLLNNYLRTPAQKLSSKNHPRDVLYRDLEKLLKKVMVIKKSKSDQASLSRALLNFIKILNRVLPVKIQYASDNALRQQISRALKQ